MESIYDSAAFDRGIEPIVQLFTADQTRRLAELRPDDALRERLEELAHKSTEGDLTPQDRAEYEGYVRANKFVAILQAKARQVLATPPG